jgi:eukaryotic translation initiation factor 2C
VTVGFLRLILVRFQVLQYAQSDFIQDAGMQISTQPISINGKVLSPPELSYGQQTAVVSSLFLQQIRFRSFFMQMPQHGGWNMVGKTFYMPAKLNAWAIVDYGRNEEKAREFASKLLACFSNLGGHHSSTKPLQIH